MTTKPLEPGDEIRCPQCRRWHPVHQRHTEGAPYTVRMLYFECRASKFYAGQVGAARAEGRSWRDVGRALGVGVATARAAFKARAENPAKFGGRN